MKAKNFVMHFDVCMSPDNVKYYSTVFNSTDLVKIDVRKLILDELKRRMGIDLWKECPRITFDLEID